MANKNKVFVVGHPVPYLTRWITFDQEDFMKYLGEAKVKDQAEVERLEAKYSGSDCLENNGVFA